MTTTTSYASSPSPVLSTHPVPTPPMPTALSVNLNKVALVRNTRHNGIPSVIQAAKLCLTAGAAGITVHPRPDERHIRAHDVAELQALLKQWPHAEFNIEGNPHHNLMPFVASCRPQQVTFVPDAQNQLTSDHGWQLDQMSASDLARLQSCIHQAQHLGARVSLFLDPIESLMPHAKALGANRIELYTESFATAHGTPNQAVITDQYARACRAAVAAGLEVNAGHDLNLHNLSDFLRACPSVKEVSIGHAFVSDALELGYAQTVLAYLQAIKQGHAVS